MWRVRAILWDMDGVIADTGEAHYLAWQVFFAERGETLSYERFAVTFGMSNLPILHEWLGPEYSLEALQALADHKEVLFRQQVHDHVRILPGVRQALQRAREQGYRQAVASSGPMANIIAVLGVLDVADYFDAMLSGARLPRSKPDPAVFLQAASAVGAQPAECLVIEDGIVGVEAARRAGIRCLAVTTTHSAEKLAGADLIVERLDQLTEDDWEHLWA